MTSPEVSVFNALFADELYRQWKADPASVEAEWQAFFTAFEEGRAPGHHLVRSNGAVHTAGHGVTSANGAAPPAVNGSKPGQNDAVGTDDGPPVYREPVRADEEGSEGQVTDVDAIHKQSRVTSMHWAYRDIGYLYADLNPLKYTTPELRYMMLTVEGAAEHLDLQEFGLSEEDLEREVHAGRYIKPERMPLRDLLAGLNRIYCGTLGSEFMHIQNKPMRRWVIERLEKADRRKVWSAEDKRVFQNDLIRAEEFEHFIHTNFIGQKRFSLEGGDSLIPALHYLIASAAQHNIQEVVLGMAHRGRLNVFTNALNRQPADIFARFIDNYKPHDFGGSGDVKYHLGYSFDYEADNGARIHISMVANPSHLEAVDPVVEGKARGIQRRRGDRNRKKVVPVLIHGDAAFSGQGVVAETFNLSQLKGYKTGGTVHIITNNQIGFTTASRDARSTFFATDVAKAISVPIFHVNADDPEAVCQAIDLAMRWRQKFGYDVIVDLICYRRLGHNEADEPSFTHPLMYDIIKSHPTTATLYGQRLADSGEYPAAAQQEYRQTYREHLRKELELAKGGYQPRMNDAFQGKGWEPFTARYSFEPVPTGVGREDLDDIARRLVTVPEGFGLHSKLKRFVQDKEKGYFERNAVDWALGESLAFGSLLLDGYSIRLSGEDCGRGTFSQRHAIWWDVNSPVPRTHMPLRHLRQGQGWVSIYDSPLSEFGVLGFDYGYSLAQPDTLTIWEAQFGDFVNGAQVIIDTFIAAAETKWFRASGLVMLLPHGYEGQGPEHSSAHLERFLLLCAEDNLQIINATTPAQYFHVLRRQMHQPHRKPLIIMTPKSLLRHKQAVSSVDEMTSGSFQNVIDDPARPDSVELVLLCSGKIYYDLLARRAEMGAENRVAIVRLEQFYPFPAEQLQEVIASYPTAAPLRWVQEESRNRGGWTFVYDRFVELQADREISYVGRIRSASPATGSHNQHASELKQLLDQAFSGVS